MTERLFGPIEVPILKSVGRKKIAEFMTRYETYKRVAHSRRAIGEDIPTLGLRFCVDAQLLKAITRYELKLETVEDLTDEALGVYLTKCLMMTEMYVPDLGVLFSGIKFQQKAGGLDRVVRLFSDVDEMILLNGLHDVEEKLLVKYIIEIIQPEELRRGIQNEIQVQGKENYDTRDKLFPLVKYHVQVAEYHETGGTNKLEEKAEAARPEKHDGRSGKHGNRPKAVAIVKGEPPGRMAGRTGADPRTTGTKEGGTVGIANSEDASTVVKTIVWPNVLYVPPQREAGF